MHSSALVTVIPVGVSVVTAAVTCKQQWACSHQKRITMRSEDLRATNSGNSILGLKWAAHHNLRVELAQGNLEERQQRPHQEWRRLLGQEQCTELPPRPLDS